MYVNDPKMYLCVLSTDLGNDMSLHRGSQVTDLVSDNWSFYVVSHSLTFSDKDYRFVLILYHYSYYYFCIVPNLNLAFAH